ncbi:hypothetical protein FW774_19115 [Pedobacter sp. BS3]|uniref:hypothetical protein n=1 Tax=Pedobacter sp. BS3 TaxID=2567937 RepID=UPI0011EFB167|nr:hypothetical protein [Pedobacter sp. BS3]TZF81164.1 hypothetical protein FW774_19115 [Pedobacter sp. BS3]
MKAIWKIAAIAVCMAVATGASAQDKKKDTVKIGEGIDRAAKKVGHKTAEVASKGAAKIVDKTYKDKVGPQGQTIYIDSHSKYYWINKKGEKVYVTKAQLKDAPKE